jgi:hypothetical protein
MDFNMFCKKTAKYLGLELYTMKENAKRAVTMCATKSLPNPPYQVEFSDMTLSEEHPYFCAEVYGNLCGKNILLGYIGWEKVAENFGNFEHWECQVSPEGLYNEEFMPVNKNGEEVDGELWQYYYGGSLKRACKSFLKGGAMTNPARKPKRVW